MRSIVLVSAVLLSASTCLAQTSAPSQPAAPAAAAQSGGDGSARQTGPSNLCQELLAFMTAPEPAADAATPAKPAPAASEQAASATNGPANEKGTSALAGTTDSDQAASDSGTNSAQDITGQEGVATDAPDSSGNEEQTAAGSVEDAPQRDSRAAPTPPADVTSTPKETVLSVDEAQRLAAANDLAQCQSSARKMRVAGVDMPPPLMALAALDLKYQQNSADAIAPDAGDEPASDN